MIQLLIADDHAAVRQGLKLLFDLLEDVVVVAEAVDGQEALQAVHRGGLDLALIDLSMPGLSGVELIERIRTTDQMLPILVLSMHSEAQVVQRALAAGAQGYLVKGCDSEELVEAVRRLAIVPLEQPAAAAGRYVECPCSAGHTSVPRAVPSSDNGKA